MGLRLLILNCNNTVRQSIANPGGYINSPKDQRIIKGAENTLRKLDVTWTIIGVHNAGGVNTYNKDTGTMFQTLEEAIAEQRYTLRLLRDTPGIQAIKAIYICPQGKGNGTTALKITSTGRTNFAGDGYRLPMPGMISLAIKSYSNSKTTDFLYVGDDDTDQEAATNLNIPFKFAKNWWTN